MHLARQVIEHHHRIGDHQQDVRCTQWIMGGAVRQFLLDVAHTVIAEVANQATVEAWQPLQGRHVVAGLELLDEVQRVSALMALYFDHRQRC